MVVAKGCGCCCCVLFLYVLADQVVLVVLVDDLLNFFPLEFVKKSIVKLILSLTVMGIEKQLDVAVARRGSALLSKSRKSSSGGSRQRS